MKILKYAKVLKHFGIFFLCVKKYLPKNYEFINKHHIWTMIVHA